MLMFRVESDKRYGPYTSGSAGSNTGFGGNGGKHPVPYEDSKLVAAFAADGKTPQYNPSWRHGFESIDQFRRWYYNDEWLPSLNLEGCVLGVYDVPKAYIGETQCLFPAQYHTLENRVAMMNLTTFLSLRQWLPNQMSYDCGL